MLFKIDMSQKVRRVKMERYQIVSEEELEIFKKAAKLEAYASYSEFVRRTALKEASKIIKENENIQERENA